MTLQNLDATCASARGRKRRWLSLASLRQISALVRLWNERSRQRIRLAELDDDRLLDLGLHRADALREAAKPFWR